MPQGPGARRAAAYRAEADGGQGVGASQWRGGRSKRWFRRGMLRQTLTPSYSCTIVICSLFAQGFTHRIY